MANNIPLNDELQEKALYDIIQYLPLDKIDLKKGYSIDKIIERAEDILQIYIVHVRKQ